jgi:tetratricopeptide (TPR) repeat protein
MALVSIPLMVLLAALAPGEERRKLGPPKADAPKADRVESEAPQAPPEEDEALKEKEYSFNPLQAAKEIQAGNFYFKKGNYRAAAGRFREASRWDPNSAEAFARLGDAQEKLRDRKAAREAYERFLDIEPDSKRAAEIRRKIGAPAPK